MIFGPKKLTYLGSVERENIEQLRHWRNQPELRKYFREYREISKDMQEKWFVEKVLNDPKQINFEIHDVETKKLIGSCGLYYIHNVNRTGEFGIYIGDENFRRCGYGTDALVALLNYGFNYLGLHRIWCEVYSNNRAISTYRKIGFKDEGVMREVKFLEGEFLDSYILSILENEWRDMYDPNGIRKQEQKKDSNEKPDILKSLPEELLEKIPRLTTEEIEEALREGYNQIKNLIKPTGDKRYL